MTRQAELRAAAEQFAALAKAELGPQLLSLTLYGSVSRGDATEDSDIDILAIVADHSLAQRLWHLAGGFLRDGFVVTVLPTTPDNFQKQMTEGSPLVHDVLREGVVLYGSRPDLAGIASS